METLSPINVDKLAEELSMCVLRQKEIVLLFCVMV